MKTCSPRSSLLLHPRRNERPALKKLVRRFWRLAPEAGLRASAAVLALFALFEFNPQTLAATDTWAGGVSTNWADTGNWAPTGNNPPLTGDSLVFSSVDPSGAALTDNLMTPGTYTLTGTNLFLAGSPAYTITSGTAGVNGFTLSGVIDNASSNTQTINDVITVATTGTFMSSGTGGNILISGTVNGAGNVVAASTNLALSGTVTLANANYTGATTVNNGSTLNITGGSFGSSTSTITVGAVTTNNINVVLNVSTSGTVTAALLNMGEAGNETDASMNISGAGTYNITKTALGGNPANGGVGNSPGAITITGGNVNLGATYIGRGGGLVVNNSGAVVTASLLNVSSNAGAHNATFTLDAGSMTVGTSGSTGAFEVGTTSGDGNNSIIMVNGTLTYLGTDGLQLGSDSIFTMSGGTANLSAITVDSAPGGNGTSEVTIGGGSTLYLGGATGGIGILVNSPSATDYVHLGNTPVGALANWTSSAPITLQSGSTATFQAADSLGNAHNISLSGVLSGAGNLIKTGAGVLTLSGPNTYSGLTTLNGGTLNLGNSTALADTSGITFTSGTLQYGSGITTDVSPKIINSAGPINIDTNGQSVTFNTAFAGTNTGGLTVSDSAGTGSLTLTKAETYTANTTVATGGNLILGSGGSLGTTAVTINGTLTGATGNGGIGGNVTLNPVATLALTGGSAGGLTIGETLGIGGASASNLDFVLNSTGADVLAVTGAVSFGTVGGDINLSALSGGTAPAYGTMFNLITSAAGDLVPADFTLETTNLNIDGTNYLVTLANSTASDEIVTLSQNNVALNFYFTGTNGSSWSAINTFATDHTGATAQTGSFSSTSNVFLTADTPVNYTSETLGGNYTINSLSFTAAATSPITLANGTATAPLTIDAGNTFSDAANNLYATGIGLVV